MKAYYISPHFDDAIGSCGGKIHKDIICNNEVYVVTIFSKVTFPFSEYADSLHKYWKLKDPINERRKENDNACKSLGVKTLNLDYEDAIYRKNKENFLYPKDGDIFKNIKNDDYDLINEIYYYFKGNFDNKDVYYFPMSIGNHVDHIITNRIGKMLKTDGYNIIFYSDFSYEEEKEVNDYNIKIVKLSDNNIKAKIDAVSKYESQIFMLFESKEKIEDYYKQKLKGEEIYYE